MQHPYASIFTKAHESMYALFMYLHGEIVASQYTTIDAQSIAYQSVQYPL